jgi:hypothetical protein
MFEKIAEQRIKEAIKKGELDNLLLQGKPLKLEDLSRVPEELRMSYKILKNAGLVPTEIQLNKEIISLQKLINLCQDEDERKKLTKRMNEKQLTYKIMMEKRSPSPHKQKYEIQILKKLGI